MPNNAATEAARLSAAMMDWTDRHCRYLHRLLSRHALLYTEMVTAPALVRGGALHLLEFAATSTRSRCNWAGRTRSSWRGRPGWGRSRV